MKIGFRSGSMGDVDVAEAFRLIRDCGYDGVEVCLEPAALRPGTITRRQAERVRAEADALGLEVSSASFHADSTALNKRLDETFAAVDVAEWLGADVLVVNAERATEDENTQAQQFAAIVERMKRLCGLAGPKGIRVAVEPEPLLAIATVDDMVRLVEAVGSPALAVNLDIGHAEVTEGDVPGAIERLGGLIVHTHVEDIAGRVHKHLLPGEGDIDFPAVFAAFQRVGYDRSHTIDLFGLGDRAVETARAAVAALRRLGE